EPDQEAGIGVTDAEIADEQRRRRGEGLELERHADARGGQHGERDPTCLHPSPPRRCASPCDRYRILSRVPAIKRTIRTLSLRERAGSVRWSRGSLYPWVIAATGTS